MVFCLCCHIEGLYVQVYMYVWLCVCMCVLVCVPRPVCAHVYTAEVLILIKDNVMIWFVVISSLPHSHTVGETKVFIHINNFHYCMGGQWEKIGKCMMGLGSFESEPVLAALYNTQFVWNDVPQPNLLKLGNPRPGERERLRDKEGGREGGGEREKERRGREKCVSEREIW